MSENQQKDTLPTTRRGARPTLGFIATHLLNKNNYTIWQGVVDAAREREVNAISFIARDLGTTLGFYAQANVFYDMINADVLDGLVIWTTTFVSYAGREGAKLVLDRYHPMPIVAIEGGGPEDIPRLDMDYYQYMREAILHLVKEHGYRRIAFIRGPDTTHAAARERYQAYQDVLAEYGLPFDPDLVSPPSKGSWEQEVGEAAIALLLDQRHVDFEAVAGANDCLAIGAMRALQARGIHVPEQVAVVGFDDDTGSDSVIPPLTTISQQGYEQGRQAVEMLLTLLEGGQAPKQVNMPLKLIVRQSCGCVNRAVAQAAAEPVIVQDEPIEAVETAQRENMLSEMRQAAEAAVERLDPGRAEQLLEAFFADLKTDQPGAFLSTLDEVLRQAIAAGGQVAAWGNVILALRRCALPYLANSPMLRRAEDLWLQAQVMVGESAQQAQRYQVMQDRQQAQVLNEVRTALIATSDLEALMDTLAQQLPRLDIPSCYLSLYEHPERPTETSRLMMAYDAGRGRLEPEAGQQVFPSQYLAPEGMLPRDRPYHMVAEALYFREEQLGFVLFEVGPRDGSVYDSLREEISSALQRILLSQERKRGEEVLARERNLLRTLIDNIPDRIYAKDTESRFIICNAATARRMGMTSPDEMVGKSDFDFVPRELAERFYADDQAVIRSGQPLLNREEPLETVDGKITRWNLATKVPLLDSQGNIVGIVGLGREITDLKQSQLKLERNALQLRTAAEISRAASSLLTLDELLPQVVELIRDRFDLYYVGLFLVDEAGQHAVLQAGMGAGSAHEAGQKMLETHHQIEVGGTSMVGWCIANRQARIALDVGKDAVRLANRLLPETRSEMALPLISRGQAIGALTIQSSQAAAFTEEDISILQTMAGQVANAIENARLYERTQAALKEMEATQRRYVQKAWGEYLPSAKTTRYEIGRPGSAPLGDAVLPEMQRAAEQQSTVALSGTGDTEGTTHSALVTPITLRGNVIGVLGIHDDQGTRQWTAEEIALVEAVADRMAQTAENLRLFDETQRTLSETRALYETSREITSAGEMSEVLAAVLNNLAHTGIHAAAVALFDAPTREQAKHIELAGAWDYTGTPRLAPGVRFEIASFPLFNRITSEKALVSQDLLSDPAIDDMAKAVLGGQGLRAMAVTPLVARGQWMGVLFALMETSHTFTPSELNFHRALADQAAIAIDSRRLLAETQHRAEREQLIRQITTRIRAAGDIQGVLETTATELAQTLGASRAIVRLTMGDSA